MLHAMSPDFLLELIFLTSNKLKKTKFNNLVKVTNKLQVWPNYYNQQFVCYIAGQIMKLSNWSMLIYLHILRKLSTFHIS